MSQKHLIVVDDEPEIGQMIKNLATELGFSVATAVTAEQAVQLCQASPPDIILMDMVMPETDGIELLHSLSAIAIKAKIILMSGYDKSYLSMGESLGMAKGLNITGTLRKPFRLQDVCDQLENALGSGVSLQAS